HIKPWLQDAILHLSLNEAKAVSRLMQKSAILSAVDKVLAGSGRLMKLGAITLNAGFQFVKGPIQDITSVFVKSGDYHSNPGRRLLNILKGYRDVVIAPRLTGKVS